MATYEAPHFRVEISSKTLPRAAGARVKLPNSSQEKGLTVYVGGAPTNNTVASQLDAAQLCAVDYDVERNRFVKVDSGRIEKLFGEDFGDTIAKLVFMCPLYTHLKEFTNVFACGEKSGLNILRGMCFACRMWCVSYVVCLLLCDGGRFAPWERLVGLSQPVCLFSGSNKL